MSACSRALFVCMSVSSFRVSSAFPQSRLLISDLYVRQLLWSFLCYECFTPVCLSVSRNGAYLSVSRNVAFMSVSSNVACLSVSRNGAYLSEGRNGACLSVSKNGAHLSVSRNGAHLSVSRNGACLLVNKSGACLSVTEWNGLIRCWQTALKRTIVIQSACIDRFSCSHPDHTLH